MFRPRSQQSQKQRKSILRCGIGFTVGCGAATRKETCGQPWQNSSTESRKCGSKKPSAANSGVTLFLGQTFSCQEGLVRDHNARFNPRGVKRGADVDPNQADVEELDKKRPCIETCKALTDEALMEDKSLGNTLSLKKTLV